MKTTFKVERRGTAEHPAPGGAERLELLMDLILTAQRRGDAVVEAGWRKEATDLLISLPPSEAQALRQRTYPLRADAARDWQRRRWQSYGRIAATL